jgi:hypothetical protein
MKRITLITLVIVAVSWIGYSGYELFYKNTDDTAPKNVFCDLDGGVLLINRLTETVDAGYLSKIKKNEFTELLTNIDTLTKRFASIKIYVSANRNILILDNNSYWNKKDIKFIKRLFPLNGTDFQSESNFLKISKNVETCKEHAPLSFFIEADKKASANFWELSDGTWKRTDIYNLEKGLFEYRSSDPLASYGQPVDDIKAFESVLPAQISHYAFHERFYAVDNDSIFRNGPMNDWINLGYVSFNYNDKEVICTDYRSRQQPSLILIEKSINEDSIKNENDIASFIGFKLTSNFPNSTETRFYTLEIEDKVFFAESKSILQQISIDYQLGRTVATNTNAKERLFGGLPTFANYRFISNQQKISQTWKEHLLFEVSTKPPLMNQNEEEEKTTWSYTPGFKVAKITPIPDHLRNGTSALFSDKWGNYELIGPNGNRIWEGSAGQPIIGNIEVVDVFENDKHQFLFRTENQVYLIDLNGRSVGSFPFKSEHVLTSDISSFIWNGTTRFLVGNQKGELIMLNGSGKELNIIQLSSNPLIHKSFALNVRGNLRAWGIDQENDQFLGYLETPAKPERLGKSNGKWFVKGSGHVKGYFEKDGEIYLQGSDNTTAQLIESGEILAVDEQVIYIQSKENIIARKHDGESAYIIDPGFNEINSTQFIQDESENYFLLMDYLKNKIYLFDNVGEMHNGFPKEGRKTAIVKLTAVSNFLSIYTFIENSIICYKIQL